MGRISLVGDRAQPDTCSSCRFYFHIDEEHVLGGECRRYPPSQDIAMILGQILDGMDDVKVEVEASEYDHPAEQAFYEMAQGVSVYSKFPIIDDWLDNWCGEYQQSPPLKEQE